jgi:hypothetical protein
MHSEDTGWGQTAALLVARQVNGWPLLPGLVLVAVSGMAMSPSSKACWVHSSLLLLGGRSGWNGKSSALLLLLLD